MQQGNARRVVSDHHVHRLALSSPSTPRRAPALSVPHTPRLVVSQKGGNGRASARGDAEAAAVAAEASGGRKTSPYLDRRTRLSQAVLLSDSSDDSGDGAGAARVSHGPADHAAGGSGLKPVSGSRQKPVSLRRQVGRDKLRRAMDDEDDEAASAAGGLVKEATAGRIGAKIVEEFGRAVSAAAAPRRASLAGRDSAPPAGPQRSPRHPREHSDALRSRGTSLPVFRALCAQCYDVGGFLCAAPQHLTATTNLRECRGKVVLMQQEDLAHGARFSAAGACALVVIAKDPEEAGNSSKCGRDTKVPVVYISEEGSKGLELGSLVKLLFDVASLSPPASACAKLSKNAHYRRILNSKDEAASGKIEPPQLAAQHPVDNAADSDDSDPDSDPDAEFCLVRRRRQSLRSTPASAKPNANIEQLVSHANDTVSQVASDDDSSIGYNISAQRRNAARQLNKTTAVSAPTEVIASAHCESVSSRTVDTVVEDIMQRGSSEMLRRVLHSTDPSHMDLADGAASDQIVSALATRLQQAVCSQEIHAKRDGVARVRELCRSRAESVAARVLDAFIRLPGSLDALWYVLAGPSSGPDIVSSESGLPAQIAAAVSLRHVALEQKNAELLLSCPDSIEILGRVMVSRTNEDLRQKVAALIANLAVEKDLIREKLCRQNLVVRGLCQLLFTSNAKALDSSLAALSNLSLDLKQTELIAKELNMERVVMILLSGGTKARHRGASLVRNLLYSPSTRGTLAQVPGMAKALQKLQKSADEETLQRATVAVKLLAEYQQQHGTEDVSMLERRLMDTGDTKLQTRIPDLDVNAAVSTDEKLPPSCKENGSRAAGAVASSFAGAVTSSFWPRQNDEATGRGLVQVSRPLASTPLPPSELSIEHEFKMLEMSKIDLFSPDIQPVSPRNNVGSSVLFPTSAPPVHPSPALDEKASKLATPVNLAHSLQQRVAGIPAPSTPPQLPGSRSRVTRAQEKSQDSCQIHNVGDVPSAHVSRILTCSHASDVLDSIQRLRTHLQPSPTCSAVQNDLGTDSRLLPLIGRMLTNDARRIEWSQDSGRKRVIDEQLLGLLFDVCKGHSKNVQRFCDTESTLSAVLKISLDGGPNETGKEAAVAAEILAFCIRDDDNWEKLAAARARLKKGSATTCTNASVSGATSHNGIHLRHSSNYLARQKSGMVQEWSA